VKGRHIVGFAAAVLPLVCSSCMFGSAPRGPDQVKALMVTIEDVARESETSQKETVAAVQALQKFAAANFGNDALAAYAELKQAVEHSEQREEALRRSLEPMKAAADTLFQSWTTDLDAFGSPELRQRSKERLENNRARFQAILKTAGSALASYTDINRRLRDHVLFFDHDLNAEALAAVQGEVRSMVKMANDLGDKLGECRTVARAYVESVNLPMAVSGTPAAPESGKN
jgi:Protein of unknown function (DUF2959)